jgi:hypothetical protein
MLELTGRSDFLSGNVGTCCYPKLIYLDVLLLVQNCSRYSSWNSWVLSGCIAFWYLVAVVEDEWMV